MDPRIEKLAFNLLHQSVKLKKSERLLIEIIGDAPRPLVQALLKEAYHIGAMAYVQERNPNLERAWLLGASKVAMEERIAYELTRMKKMDAYIAIRASDNTAALSDVPKSQQTQWSSIERPLIDERVNHTRWCVLRYPTPSMAQLATMSEEAFADFYFDVCNLDYAHLASAMEPLKKRMEQTDKVRIVAKDTDLTFSIKGMPAVICAGDANIPDGEIYTAPIRTSVEGTITYNTPSTYRGIQFDGVSLTFKEGKIISATANRQEALDTIFNTDDGARYIGEFALGVNPYITKPMNDILFDEKISGSLHFTPGACYEDADNGNTSAIHWDLVLIQTPEYGGGSIYFDDVLIRENGRFVLPELEALNPEHLLAHQ